jgi:hypothetical protein
MRFSALFRFSGFATTALLAFTALPQALGVEAPQLVQKDGR